MAFQVRTERRDTSSGLDGLVYVMEDDAAGCRAEVWPAFGFNCYRWTVARGGQALELLFTDPLLFQNSSPTRSGIPTLFPFPNRIRDGRFTWAGKVYNLPQNDSTKKNAIHGFAPRKPWRVIGRGEDAASAWVQGEFHAAQDAPEALSLWPADHRLRLTYRLTANSLRLEAEVSNPDPANALPFGLGYHPYFGVPFSPKGDPARYFVECPAAAYWNLEASLPVGPPQPVDGTRDLRRPRPFTDLQFDDVLTGLPVQPAEPGSLLVLHGKLRDEVAEVELKILASPAFRENVVFTPPHRKAICLEPYTCPTDAINLRRDGQELGLIVLAPGETWNGVVEFRL